MTENDRTRDDETSSSTPTAAEPDRPEPTADLVEPATARHGVEPEPIAAAAVDEPSAAEPQADEHPAPQPEADGHPAPDQPQVVYVPTPLPPKKKGARGLGVAVALLGAVVFTVVYAVLAVVFIGLDDPAALAERFSVFAAKPSFWMPVIAFLIGYILLVIVINRAGWWAHVLGGFLVAVLVYVVFVLSTVLSAGAFGAPVEQVQQLLQRQLTNPLGWAAAIAAREVPIWVGGLVAHRGRTITARNAEAREAYERELAELRARGGASAV